MTRHAAGALIAAWLVVGNAHADQQSGAAHEEDAWNQADAIYSEQDMDAARASVRGRLAPL